jgi:hypothetical protein
MPILHIYVTDESLKNLELCAKDRGYDVNNLASAAVEEAVLRDAQNIRIRIERTEKK